MTVVEFFFDIVSPFSVFQHELLQRQLGHWKSMELKLTPVLIRKVFEASQNAPPGLNQTKAIYLFSDLKICSQFYKIPFDVPKEFMKIAMEFKLDKTQMFLTAIQSHVDESTFRRLVGVFYQNLFNENSQELWEPSVMKKLASEVGIKDEVIDKALASMESDENRAKLDENCQTVIELGAFGLPVTLVHK
ncbi:hypothetical protein BLA29_001681, partial [Euroglyphus maynei]